MIDAPAAQDLRTAAPVDLTEAERLTLAAVSARITRPKAGLPRPVFDFAVSIVPMINVDLLVLDGAGRALLAWREDELSQGWHVPGGIIRGTETIAERIGEVAAGELGLEVLPSASPAAIVQIFGRRGHFISLVHLCRPVGEAVLAIEAGAPRPGELAWFGDMPANTYPSHGYYFDLLARFQAEPPSGAPVMIETIVDELSHRADHPSARDVRG